MKAVSISIGRGTSQLSARRLATLIDRSISVILAVTIAGSILAFGGRVWWAPLAMGVACGLLAIATVASWICKGRGELVHGAWNFAWIIMLGIVIVQILPIGFFRGAGPRSPAALERLLVNATGAIRDDPVEQDTGPDAIVTADRSATLRCAAHGLGLFVIFLLIGPHVDRVSRLTLIWKSIIAGFAIATCFTALQLVADATGAFGIWTPGQGPPWAPSSQDILSGPVEYRVRPAARSDGAHFAWLQRRADVPFATGPLVEGPGAYLSLSVLAIPLLVAIILHRLAPRGSTEPLRQRLRHCGGLPQLYVLCGIGSVGAFLAGFLGGSWIGGAIGTSLLLACLLGGLRTGMRRAAWLSAVAGGLLIAGGVLVGNLAGRPEGSPWLARTHGAHLVRGLWRDAILMLRSFPLLGVGAGGFDAVEPYLKQTDVNSSTAQSSLLQWGAEFGIAGIVVGLAALAWAAHRLPSAWRNVGEADRPLAAGLVGAAAGFLLLSCIHSTVQYPSTALCVTAIGAATHRWLSGATDLFVDEPLVG